MDLILKMDKLVDLAVEVHQMVRLRLEKMALPCRVMLAVAEQTLENFMQQVEAAELVKLDLMEVPLVQLEVKVVMD